MASQRIALGGLDWITEIACSPSVLVFTVKSAAFSACTSSSTEGGCGSTMRTSRAETAASVTSELSQMVFPPVRSAIPNRWKAVLLDQLGNLLPAALRPESLPIYSSEFVTRSRISSASERACGALQAGT